MSVVEVATKPLYVLNDREENRPDYSFFWATVYDPEIDEVRVVQTGHWPYTGPWAYCIAGYHLDRRPDAAIIECAALAQAIAYTKARREVEWNEANAVAIGVEVEFASSYNPRKEGRRAVQIGETGVVVDMQVDDYKTPRYADKYGWAKSYRCRVRLPDADVWVGKDKLRVLNPANEIQHPWFFAQEYQPADVERFRKQITEYVTITSRYR